VVDTLGLILAVVVHSAAVQDRDGALAVLAKLLSGFPRLALIWADGGYAGRLVRFLERWKRSLGWVLQIVKRTDDLVGFVVLPKRWIVERTFGWLGRYRRLSKDYEEQTRNSETMIQIAMINLMLHRLKPG
jgi:putative transposase